jgi:threonine dehydrogenase-like Zn-dependent dehydrogenase
MDNIPYHIKLYNRQKYLQTSSRMHQPTVDPFRYQINTTGICGSDMHAYHGKDPRRVPPLILAMKWPGTIASGPREGVRAVINTLIT